MFDIYIQQVLVLMADGDINLRATWIFSRNDMLANVGVLIAAVLIAYTQTGWSYIIIGLMITGIVIYSAVKIINEAK